MALSERVVSIRRIAARGLTVCVLSCSAVIVVHAQAPITCQGIGPNGMVIELMLDSPTVGQIVTGLPPCGGSAVVEGRAFGDVPTGSDVIIIVDSSASTAAASGIDIDGDGVIGVGDDHSNTDPGDSVLAAELAAVDDLLVDLAGRDVRVALVEFSAVLATPAPGEQGRVRVAQGLTDQFNLVRDALDDVRRLGSVGATDYAAALDTALAEWRANGVPQRPAQVLFLTDGQPTVPRYPYDTTEIHDISAARDAADRLAQAGLVVNTHEIGNFDTLGLLAEIATTTGGVATRMSVSAITINLPAGQTAPARILRVIIHDDTSGVSVDATVAPDGSFTAQVPLVPDVNRLRVVVVPEGGAGWELECETIVLHDCPDDADLCFRSFTQGVLDELLTHSAPLLEGFEALTPCGALRLDDDVMNPCAAALREYTTLVINEHDGRLTSRCRLDLSSFGPGLPTATSDAIDYVNSLLQLGDAASCTRAAAIAAAINTGSVVTQDPPGTPGVVECVVQDTSGDLTVSVQITAPLHGNERPLEPPCDGEVVVEGIVDYEGAQNLFDLFFVIDSSGSTDAASGRDVDGDGTVGTGDPSSDPGDSVLEAELQAVRQFVGDLDPAWARVSIIEFAAILSGTSGRMRLVQSLTDDFSLVHAALDDISMQGSSGATDYGGAIMILNDEFTMNADPVNRIPICFFLSDGIPTFPEPPYNTTEPPDRQRAIDATLQSAALGIEINTYEVGQAGAAAILQEMATLTGGQFFASLVAGDIIDVLNSFELVRVTDVDIENIATGQTSVGVIHPDGTFEGTVQLVAGENDVLVSITVVDRAGNNVVVADCATTVDLLFQNLACNPWPSDVWESQCDAFVPPEVRLVTFEEMPSGDLEIGFLRGSGGADCRAYRGELDTLAAGYSHSTPFSGMMGSPECLIAPGVSTFVDRGVIGDGRNWYYLVAMVDPVIGPHEFGISLGGTAVARPGPGTPGVPRVTDACP